MSEENQNPSTLKTFWPLFLIVTVGLLALGSLSLFSGEGNRKRLPSGVEYIVLAEGDGAGATNGDVVQVHYTGTLAVNGKKFDSSLDRGEPFKFTLGKGEVIRGWDEGVAGMKTGEKRKLFIPAPLGYGSRGAGENIPPNSDLVFEVELLKIGK